MAHLRLWQRAFSTSVPPGGTFRGGIEIEEGVEENATLELGRALGIRAPAPFDAVSAQWQQQTTYGLTFRRAVRKSIAVEFPKHERNRTLYLALWQVCDLFGVWRIWPFTVRRAVSLSPGGAGAIERLQQPRHRRRVPLGTDVLVVLAPREPAPAML